MDTPEKKELNTIEYQPITQDSAGATYFSKALGNWVLYGDITFTDNRDIALTGNLNICLNGYTLTMGNWLKGEYTIYIFDCKEEAGSFVNSVPSSGLFREGVTTHYTIGAKGPITIKDNLHYMMAKIKEYIMLLYQIRVIQQQLNYHMYVKMRHIQ